MEHLKTKPQLPALAKFIISLLLIPEEKIMTLFIQDPKGNEIIRRTLIESIKEVSLVELSNLDLNSVSRSETAYNLVKRVSGEERSIESFYEESAKKLEILKSLDGADKVALGLNKYLVWSREEDTKSSSLINQCEGLAH